MFEDPKCTRCPLHETATHVCLPGSGRIDSGARLLLLVDHPTFVEDRSNKPMSSEGVKLVHWMFKRMGMTSDQYYLEYVIKCCPSGGKLPTNKAARMQAIEACSTYRTNTLHLGAHSVVVGLGRLACEALTGSQELNKFDGTWWEPTEASTRQFSPVVWIGPGVNAVLMNPGIAGELHRLLWAAAVHANYQPVLTQVAPFDWSEFIK